MAPDGTVVNWFLTPRNSSLFDKLFSSGAAKRSLYSAATDAHVQSLGAANSLVRFNRYPDIRTVRGVALGILNAAHFAISVANLVNDFSAASKTLEEIAKNERAIGLLGTCVGLDGVFTPLQSLQDLAWDTTAASKLRESGANFLDAGREFVLAIAENLASGEGALCIGKAAKLIGADWSKIWGQQVVASSIDALGTLAIVKVVLDGVNDTVPNVLSLFLPWSEQQSYYLTWDRDAQNNPILTSVSEEATQGPVEPPTAIFTIEQRPGEGLAVYFDASTSQFDFRAMPSFAWDFGDGATGAGALISHTYAATGKFQVGLTVDDGLGQTDTKTGTITVRNGVPPVIEAMSCSLDPTNARRVIVQARVTDPDGDLASLEWWRAPLVFELLPDEVTDPGDQDVALTYPDDSVTAFTPTLRAVDAAGNTTTRTCTVFPSAGAPYPLNDTGITTCSDAATNGLPCPVAGFPGQDGESGRDADVAQNDDSDGHAGFSFTKLDANGNALPASATSWSCVQDNVTGRIWEVKTDDGGLRDQDWTYSWYNPDASTNGGFAGYEDYGDNCFDSARCDTDKYVADVNAQGLCGANDWRLPDPRELMSIVRNDRYNPAIDTAWFPNTPPDWFWSSSPDAYGPNYAWYVYFGAGYVDSHGKNYAVHVRLVRAGQ